MRVPLLSEDEIGEHLGRPPGWARQDEGMTKTYSFADFGQAMEFVNLVAEAAESVDHHPDFDIRYAKVTLRLTTHDSGGLTLNDTEMAAACDGFADGVKA